MAARGSATALRPAAGLLIPALAFLTACGYHLAGRGSTLPDHVRRIGVPMFENRSEQPEIAQRLLDERAGAVATDALFEQVCAGPFCLRGLPFHPIYWHSSLTKPRSLAYS